MALYTDLRWLSLSSKNARCSSRSPMFTLVGVIAFIRNLTPPPTHPRISLSTNMCTKARIRQSMGYDSRAQFQRHGRRNTRPENLHKYCDTHSDVNERTAFQGILVFTQPGVHSLMP